MKLYSINIKIYGTAYIKAETEEEALQKAKDNLTQVGLEFPHGFRDLISEHADGNIFMTGERFNFDMPEISFSPVMTSHGPSKDAHVELSANFDEDPHEAIDNLNEGIAAAQEAQGYA